MVRIGDKTVKFHDLGFYDRDHVRYAVLLENRVLSCREASGKMAKKPFFAKTKLFFDLEGNLSCEGNS